MSPSLISQIETDKSQPSVSTLYAITTALDITIESLFGESDGSATELSSTQDGAAVQESAAWPTARMQEILPTSVDPLLRSPGRAAGRSGVAHASLGSDLELSCPQLILLKPASSMPSRQPFRTLFWDIHYRVFR